MALIDVADLIIDPDFSSAFVQIKRAATIDDKGRMNLTETSFNRIGVVQDINNDNLRRFPEAADFIDGITVWCQSQLEAESLNGYCDVIVWNGQRYLVKIIDQNFMNFGSGWTSAICSKEVANNSG